MRNFIQIKKIKKLDFLLDYFFDETNIFLIYLKNDTKILH